MSSVLKQSPHVVYKTQLRERRTRHAAMLAVTNPHCKKPIKFKINTARDRPATGCLVIAAVCTLRYHAPVFFKPLILFSQDVFVQILQPLWNEHKARLKIRIERFGRTWREDAILGEVQNGATAKMEWS